MIYAEDDDISDSDENNNDNNSDHDDYMFCYPPSAPCGKMLAIKVLNK